MRAAVRKQGQVVRFSQTWQRSLSTTAISHRDTDMSTVKYRGRQSSSGITATVFGASGFVGRYVVSRLGRIGSQCVVPYRGDGMKIRHLKPMGDLGSIVPVPLDMTDENTIREAIKHSNVVVNLIGNRNQTNNYSYDDVHVKCTHRIAKICAENPEIKRFIHVSAMCADKDSPSEFFASKARGEDVVKDYFPEATIIRPAITFGDEDYFLNQMANQISMNHWVPTVGDGSQKLQPVYVQDLAQCIVNSLVQTDAPGKTYTIAGPKVYTRSDIMHFVKKDILRPEAQFIPYPKAVCTLLGKLAEKFVPHYERNLSPDIVEQMGIDQVLSRDGTCTAEDLGIQPVPMEESGRNVLLQYRGARQPEHFDWNAQHAKGYGNIEAF